MAHIKTGAAVKGNRDSISKRLGVKLYGGQKAGVGSIIIRQRGTQVHPGKGTSIGKDDTIFASIAGTVQFKTRLGKKFVVVVGA